MMIHSRFNYNGYISAHGSVIGLLESKLIVILKFNFYRSKNSKLNYMLLHSRSYVERQ